MTATAAPPAPAVTPAPAPDSGQWDLRALERAVATSWLLACCVIVGLPALGVAAAISLNLPSFATMMAGCFCVAVGVTCHNAVTAFAGRVLRLLVAARLVVIGVLASLLFVSTGSVWTTLVSAILTWLVADRLLGRRALVDLYKMSGSRS